ncbi:MAG: ice-binding family protein [Gemmatimonadales bacterium]
MKMSTIFLVAAALLVGACNGDSSTGVSPAAPTIMSTGPTNNATGVSTTGAITALFSEAMDPITVNTVSFRLTKGGVWVPAAVSVNGAQATLVPTSRLDSNVVYVATISTAASNVAGIRLAVLKAWTFTTVNSATAAPTVTATTPADAATGIALNTTVTATFSHAMAPATINTTTFSLKHGVTAVPAAVTYSGSTATLTPTSSLDSNLAYTATISTGTADPAGAALATAKSWTFTTVTTPPSVVSTSPINAASGVVRNASVTATFSRVMDSSTIDSMTFTLKAGVNPVAGVVSYTGTTGTFNPTGTLAANTVYTAAISTGATDAAGQHLAAIKSWTFTTVATSVSGPAVVNLGTAGNYIILAKTGVSTTGASSFVGDIGLSPAAATFITGFGLILDGSNTFATSSLVTGKVWAADYTAPTPSNLTTAVLDMQTAYTDAAGRVLPDFTELGAGNIQGMTLVPGLYKWGTGVSIPSAVTLSGGTNDIWIFQIAQDLTVGNGAIVTLTGGAQAKNVFWQVAGSATLGTTSQFQGIILSQTLISFNTGATMTGRALAQTAVTLNATTVTHP